MRIGLRLFKTEAIDRINIAVIGQQDNIKRIDTTVLVGQSAQLNLEDLPAGEYYLMVEALPAGEYSLIVIAVDANGQQLGPISTWSFKHDPLPASTPSLAASPTELVPSADLLSINEDPVSNVYVLEVVVRNEQLIKGYRLEILDGTTRLARKTLNFNVPPYDQVRVPSNEIKSLNSGDYILILSGLDGEGRKITESAIPITWTRPADTPTQTHTFTPSPTLTLTHTPTDAPNPSATPLSAADVVNTAIAATRTQFVTETLIAIASFTQTPPPTFTASHTPSQTPDVPASIEAGIRQTDAALKTATATLWTKTPTNTATYTPTSISTPITLSTRTTGASNTCRASGDLVVGTDAAYPPFAIVNTETNQIEGFDVDLLNAIGEKAGFNPLYNNVPFDPILINLAAGQYDIVISAVTITEERSKTVAFSNPYFAAGQVIAARKDEAGTLNTPAALAGKTVGVQLGTTGAEAAKGINGVTVREYQTLPEAMTALSNKDVDAVVGDNVTVLTIILNQPELNLAQAGDPFTVEYYGIAVRQECTDLLAAINSGLQAIIEDGTYQTIYEKYLGEAPAAEFRKGAKGILPAMEGTPEATPEATATPLPAGFERDFDGVPMVWVPAGCFMMGSNDGNPSEEPVHEICFDEGFWIDKYEVSNGQFNSKGGQAGRASGWTDDTLPRESITWFEARDFCALRGGRLPTEAEWEYAARGPQSLNYPWGNDFIGDNLVYGGNSGGKTAPIGSRPAGKSWVGALDMSGNVWEWTSSIYKPYPYVASDGRESTESGARVLRGGSWKDSLLRAAYRSRYSPVFEFNFRGFRCVFGSFVN